MKYYTSTTEFNCGIDLHSREMYICLVDHEGQKLVHTNIKGKEWDWAGNPEGFLDRPHFDAWTYGKSGFFTALFPNESVWGFSRMLCIQALFPKLSGVI